MGVEDEEAGAPSSEDQSTFREMYFLDPLKEKVRFMTARLLGEYSFCADVEVEGTSLSERALTAG